jgi:hypothetical protein
VHARCRERLWVPGTSLPHFNGCEPSSVSVLDHIAMEHPCRVQRLGDATVVVYPHDRWNATRCSPARAKDGAELRANRPGQCGNDLVSCTDASNAAELTKCHKQAHDDCLLSSRAGLEIFPLWPEFNSSQHIVLMRCSCRAANKNVSTKRVECSRCATLHRGRPSHGVGAQNTYGRGRRSLLIAAATHSPHSRAQQQHT